MGEREQGGPSGSPARRGGEPRDPVASPPAPRDHSGRQPAEKSDCDDHMPWSKERGEEMGGEGRGARR